MGIEVPEQYGGAGGIALPWWRSPSRRSPAWTRRRRSWWTCRTRSSTTRSAATAATTSSARYLPRLTARTVGAYALSEPGSRLRRVRPRRRAPSRRATTGCSPGGSSGSRTAREAEIYRRLRERGSAAGYKGITAFLVERGLQGLQRRQEGGQARHPRLEHHGADPRDCEVPAENVLGPVGQGLQDRDRDAERGPDRHRRADDRRRRAARSTRRSRT